MTTPVPRVEQTVAQRPVRRRSWLHRVRWRELIASVAFFFFVMIALQQLLPVLGVHSYILPTPTAVLNALINDISHAQFWMHVWTTLRETLFGWALGASTGFVLGVILTQSAFLEAALTPYVVALQAVPKVALAPIIVVWLGYGQTSKIAIAAIVAFFPVLVNTMVGVRHADRQQLELLRALRANRLQTLRWVQLPGAMPTIFGGLEIAVVFAVVGAIVGEFTGASAGLGYLIEQRNFSLDQAGVFSTLVILSIMGLTLDLIVRRVGRYVVRWQQLDSVVGV